MPTLPIDEDGKLQPYTPEEITAMDIRRRGVRQDDHVRYNFGPDGSYCVRKFSCAWDERFKAQIHFVGAVVQYQDSGNDKISRLMPQTDPEYTDWICTKCEIAPFQFTGNIEAPVTGSEPYPEFDRAELTATYELVPYDVATDEEVAGNELLRYVTKPGFPGADVQTSANYLTLPGGVMWYTTADGTSRPAGIRIQHGVGFVEGRGTFKVIWRRLPFDAWGASSTLTQRVLGTVSSHGYVGGVNQTSFLGYPALSLQLLGVEQKLLPDPTGIGYSWEIGYVLSHAPTPYGHLGFYFHDTASTGGVSGYYQAQRETAGKTTVAAASLTDTTALFVPREFADLFVIGEL